MLGDTACSDEGVCVVPGSVEDSGADVADSSDGALSFVLSISPADSTSVCMLVSEVDCDVVPSCIAECSDMSGKTDPMALALSKVISCGH